MRIAVACLLLGAAGLAVLGSCQPARVYERNEPVGPEWAWGEAARLEVEIADTVSPHDLYVNVRHDDRYGYRNVWLIVRTIFPSGDTAELRADVKLASVEGPWLGACTGRLCFRRELLRNQRLFPDRRFPEPGRYAFEIEQDMRVNPLEGIRDVGIRIERVKEVSAE